MTNKYKQMKKHAKRGVDELRKKEVIHQIQVLIGKMSPMVPQISHISKMVVTDKQMQTVRMCCLIHLMAFFRSALKMIN